MRVPITKPELDALIERKRQASGRVLSLYLDVDQSRQSNLNRGFLRNAREMMKSCLQKLREPPEREEFAQVEARVLAFLNAYEPRGRGLALFADKPDGIFWQRELHIPVENAFRWADHAYIRPLVEAIDEHERYGVVLASREKARIFTMFLGEIEEKKVIQAPEKIKHIRAVGMEMAEAQINLQRRGDEHALRHFKEVAGEVERLVDRHEIDRLIVSGPHETNSELIGCLSKRVQQLVVGELSLTVDARETEVLQASMRMEEEVERKQESELVERLITAAHKDNQGALSLHSVLEAMLLGRIMKLVYVYGYTVGGVQCTNCGSLFLAGVERCAYCSGEVRAVDDIVSRLVDSVVESGGNAENVRGAAADRLGKAGSIGAFLRF